MPLRVWRGGRERTVTHVAASWVRPAPWWAESDGTGEHGVADLLRGERTYMKIVLDGALVYDIFSVDEGAAWFVERIYD